MSKYDEVHQQVENVYGQILRKYDACGMVEQSKILRSMLEDLGFLLQFTESCELDSNNLNTELTGIDLEACERDSEKVWEGSDG